MFKDIHVVITGAGKGLGKSVARAYHQAGASVSLIGRSGESLKELTEELGERSAYFQADLRNSVAINESLQHFRSIHGPVDILVNNAGTGSYKPFTESSDEEILETIEVNLTGLIMISKAVIPEMISRKKGQLIHIASDLGRRPLANMAVYSATKHAVVGFSQSLARELKDFGIRSMVLTPGLIDTFFGGREEGSIEEPYALRGEEIAEVILFMSSRNPNIIIDELSIHPARQDF